jgi:DNA-binding CsgD family transcriptional regulator
MSALGGDWAGALGEAASAQLLLRGTAAGQAAYQLGEVHRLMGSADEAEDCYRQANALGVQPEPGLSRLRTGQGRPEVAARTLRRLCGEPRPPADRAELLAARVEAELALDDVDAALEALRSAQQRWSELDVPHAGAQVRVLTGLCLAALGDGESADLEFAAARECFERLGAAPDLVRLDELRGAGLAETRPGGLTEREVEVVRLVAVGHTNRTIARQLCLSEKTVARHLANVYAKLDVPSRAAATAYAYDHGLVKNPAPPTPR